MATGARTATNTGTRRMPIDARLLTLTQWLSPAYPIGSFAFSHGLEAACADSLVTDAPGLERWLSVLLKEGSGWTDAVLMSMAARGARAVSELDALSGAYAASRERRREAERQGRAFALTTARVWNLDLKARFLPVVLGEAAFLLKLEAEALIALYLQSFVTNLVGAAQRLMPLGQTDAQAILAHLSPLCADVAKRALHADEGDVFSNGFGSDIAAMRHETMKTRVFQT
ncbi:urease accessory protein UreF [Sagittula marina]|uniref:urease accessory protein UreF n=2 Tax=Sagittula marina TaxID=943940 RepID=UPI0031B5E1D3